MEGKTGGDKKGQKGNYHRKVINLGGEELTLFSLDGVTWSSEPDELHLIQERRENPQASFGDKKPPMKGSAARQRGKQSEAPASNEQPDGQERGRKGKDVGSKQQNQVKDKKVGIKKNFGEKSMVQEEDVNGDTEEGYIEEEEDVLHEINTTDNVDDDVFNDDVDDEEDSPSISESKMLSAAAIVKSDEAGLKKKEKERYKSAADSDSNVELAGALGQLATSHEDVDSVATRKSAVESLKREINEKLGESVENQDGNEEVVVEASVSKRKKVVKKKPAAKKVAAKKTVAKKAAAKKTTAKKTTTKKTVSKKTAKKSAAKKTAAKKPAAAKKTTAKKPAVKKKSTTKGTKATTTKKVVKKPVAKKPAVKKPATKKTTAKAKKPVAKKTAVKKKQKK